MGRGARGRLCSCRRLLVFRDSSSGLEPLHKRRGSARIHYASGCFGGGAVGNLMPRGRPSPYLERGGKQYLLLISDLVPVLRQDEGQTPL